MKLTKLRGIAHDLAHYLDNQFWHGYYKDLNKVNTNILEQKDQFNKACLEFFKERLPKKLDMNKIKKIQVKADRIRWTLTITVKVSADDTEFSYSAKSITSFA